jgi:hypothetical protein
MYCLWHCVGAGLGEQLRWLLDPANALLVQDVEEHVCTCIAKVWVCDVFPIIIWNPPDMTQAPIAGQKMHKAGSVTVLQLKARSKSSQHFGLHSQDLSW